MNKNVKLILLLIFQLVLGILIDHFFIKTPIQISKPNEIFTYPTSQNNINEFRNQISPNVHVINLNETVQGNFQCIKTKTLLNYINTNICLHNIQNDIYVSQTIQGKVSIWEEEAVTRILKFLLNHPALDFIDIGANIGTYTMYVASLGRFVLAIDCFAPNLQRLHRALQLTDVTNRAVLVQNAIYTRTGDTLRLLGNSVNIGGQNLDLSMTKTDKSSITNDPYLVKTIKFDDVLPILLGTWGPWSNNEIDIEGSESFVVESGGKIFDEIEIPLVQMEWEIIRKDVNRSKIIIDFFTKRNYEVKSLQCLALNLNNYFFWPTDIYWIKMNASNLC